MSFRHAITCQKKGDVMFISFFANLFRSEHIFKSLVQQCCEKIDRTRAIAGHVFSCLLYHR